LGPQNLPEQSAVQHPPLRQATPAAHLQSMQFSQFSPSETTQPPVPHVVDATQAPAWQIV
jgi:hypothetical protein